MNNKLIVFFILFLFGCSAKTFVSKTTKGKDAEIKLASINNNVCKKLSGKVVLYAIFVDTKESKPWSEFDVFSTLDSIKRAMNWIKFQAQKNNKSLDIEIVYHSNNSKIPIAMDFPKKTFSKTLFQRNMTNGLKEIHGWTDKIASLAAKSLPPDNSKIISTKNTLNDKERLVARLRDLYKTDNVAIIYFINNYFKKEVSIAFNIQSHTEIEYAIVSYKEPSVIAHEFLHLFGAWDLYISPFYKDKKLIQRKKNAMSEFPNEIMAFAYRDLDSLSLCPFTKYCIGWENVLDDKYTKMILGKNLKPVKY